METPPQNLINVLRQQASWCERLGSPLYNDLLVRIADDVQSSGPYRDFLESYGDDFVLPLRFLGAIHRMVLEGTFPELAPFYPSAGGAADPEGAYQAIRRELELDGGARIEIPKSVQTNEVARCCALLPGFLEVAARTKLPLRLLEIGCSAGLNLRWDRYRYQTSGGVWGDTESGVVFERPFVADPPFLDAPVQVVERLGCDLNPVDVSTEAGRLTLLSFVWPDQLERLHRLSKAVEVAARTPALIERANAVDWLERQLEGSPRGITTVVFHSIVLLYLSPAERERLVQILTEAGDRATPETPLAWLTMERGETEVEVNLTLWPGGRRSRIATASYHGPPVKPEPQNSVSDSTFPSGS